MELGCSTILYGGHDLSVALERIAHAGYRAIELGAIARMAPHLELGSDAAYYEGVRAMVEERGLEIESIGGSGNFGDQDRFLKVLDAAAAVGAPIVTSGAGGTSDDDSSFKEVVENLNGMAVKAESRGVKISVKPHVKNAVYNTETALKMMGEVNQDWIGINYDPTHIWRTPQEEIPEDTVDPLLEQMLSIRIRDVKGRQLQISPVPQQVAGEGDLNLDGLSAKLKTAPRVKYAVLEIVGTKEMAVEEIDSVIQRSHDAFKPLFA